MANVKDLLVNGSARVIGTIYGNATSANKLNTNAGSASQPVYFSNGIPVAITGNLSNNAASATKLLNARNFKIGSTSKSFNGTADVTWTHAEIGATVSNTWTGGTTAGPTLKTTVNGVTGTAVAIPSASTSASGVVTTGAQSFAGDKTFTGMIYFPNVTSGLATGIQWTVGDNDFARIRAGATGSNGGYLEIATADDANEPIYVRQYSGVFGTLKRTLTLLDASGNTYIPGSLYDKNNQELRANLFVHTIGAKTSSGTEFTLRGLNTAGSEITALTIPNASTSVAGLVTTGTQTFAGVKTFNNNVYGDFRSLTSDAIGGYLLYTDPTFMRGSNNVGIYNNTSNGNVVHERIARPSDCPSTSDYVIRITTNGTASPGYGGFYQTLSSRAGAQFVVKYLIKLPTGYKLNTASNPMGDGFSDKIISDNAGTGQWKIYTRYVKCGTSGSFSSGGHLYVENNGGAAPSVSAPLVWYLGGIWAYDITRAGINSDINHIYPNFDGQQLTVHGKLKVENKIIDSSGSEIKASLFVNTIAQNAISGTAYSIKGVNTAGNTVTTLSLPIASASQCGLITNAAQEIGGNKTFNGSSLFKGVIESRAGTISSSTSYTYPGGGYYATANPNMRFIGDGTYGISTIEFVSQKNETSINKPSDCAYIQFQPYGHSALAGVGSQPTLASSGESNKLIIGVNNDADDMIYLQTPSNTGLRHIVGTGNYVIPHTGNTSGSVGSATQPVYLNGGVITAITGSIANNTTGSSASCTGNAATATKLATARTIQTNLASTTAASFDGSANITPGITGTLPVSHGGTGQTTIANIQAGKDGDGNTITSKYVSIYNSNNIGQSSSVTVNDLAKQGSAVGMIYAATDNPFGKASWVHVWSQAWNKTVNSSWVSQIALGVDESDGMWYRTKEGTIVGAAWKKVLDSNNYTSYTVTKTGSGASGTWGISISGNATTASKVNNKLTVGSKTYDGSAAVTIAASDLGLASAMLFLGTTTTAITDGATTNPVAIGGSNKTVTAGNVVLYGSKEFVWNGSAWEELGNEGSYKVVQSAVSSPSASGTEISFIDTISQNANGVITATKKSVRDASASQSGVVSTGTQTFAGRKTFNNSLVSNGAGSYAPLLLKGGTSNYREGLRIIPTSGWSDILLGGSDVAEESGTSANSWFLGNNNGNFYITRNGSTSSTASYASVVNNYWQFYPKLGINGTNSGYNFYVNGTTYLTNYLQTASYLKSTIATGTAPIQVTSTTLNTNLNADMLDGYHLEEAQWAYSNTYNQPTAGAEWYLKIQTEDWNGTSETIYLNGSGNNRRGTIILKTGSRQADWWGYATNYNGTNIIGVKKIVSNSDDVYIRMDSACTQVVVKTTFSPRISASTDNSGYTSVPDTGGFFANRITVPTITGNASTATKLATARTIWGQSFNGTANISGNMTGVGNINTASAPAGTIYMNNWFRSTGKTGWYNETYGGGLYMSDSTYIRNYGGKTTRLDNLCLGADNNSYRLYVNGTSYFNGLATMSVGSSHSGIKIGNTYLTAIGGDLILQNNSAIRFGGDSWDYNVWAGLKYDHSNKKIVLGLADGSEFTANSAQSGGTLKFVGISTIDANKTASIRNLAVGGGIYWDPYVESTSDNSDAASITVLKSGAAGGTELRIQQANDSGDIINLVSPAYIYFNSKQAFQINDSWLRINPGGSFSTGTYFNRLVRTDGELQARDIGLYNANQARTGRLYNGTTGTAGNGTNSGAAGTAILELGNSTAVSSATNAGANNAQGFLRLYGTSTGYGQWYFDNTYLRPSHDIYFTNNGSATSGWANGIRGQVGANDYWRVGGGATGSNAGYMEIATGDDTNEPIYVRQYSGAFGTLNTTLTLLDASHNTIIPNALTVGTTTSQGGSYKFYVNGTSYFNGDISRVGNISPLTNNSKNLGSSSLKWANVYATNFHGTLDGNASTATKLATARTISLAGNLQGSATFDGSANITITALNYQAGINGGNTSNYPWHRIATATVGTGQYNDRSALLRIRHTFNGGGEGLVKISIRTNSSGAGCDISAVWLYRYNIAVNNIGIGLWGVTGDNVYLDVYYKCSGGWPRGIVESISNGRIFTLISSNEVDNTTTTDKKTSSEVYTSIENGANLIHGKAYTKIVYGSDGAANDRYVLKSGDTMTGNLTAPSVYTSNWFRSTGKTGWYSETYGGGWYMTDSNFIRNFNSKAISINVASNNAWGIGGHRLAAVFKGNDHSSILLSTNSLGYGLCVNNDGNWYWGKRTTNSETSTSGDTYLLQGNTTLVKPFTNMAIGLGQVKSSEFSSAYIRAVHTRHLDASGVFNSDMNLYIGYGDSTPTQKTLFYYSSGTHGASATSRTQFAEINSNGLYALTRFGVNGQNTSYNLYVNGTSYFNGNTTHNGIDYFANGTTYYINNSADANLRRGLFAGTSNANTAASSFFNTGALEIREAGRVGSAQSSFNFAPRIGFHWSGRIAASLSFHSDGIFYFRKQNGNDRAIIDANVNGNAATATKLATARTISLTGSVTGSGTFDGSGNLNITTTTNHSHSYLPLAGGTMTGVIRSTYKSGSWVNSLTNSAISLDDSSGSYGGWICGPTKDGRIAISTYQASNNTLYFGYGERGRTANSFAQAMTWDGPTNTLSAGKVYGAVWNDYAEYRKSDITEPGRVVIENGDGTLSLSTKRLQRGAEVISDTYGFAIGETDECKTPIATTGRVLAYTYEPVEEYRSKTGWPVCSGPNGTVSIMTEEEEEKYPSRIIGTISEVPNYEEWGTGKVKTNGRVWIRIK